MQENDHRLHTLFQLICTLRSKHCTVKQLAEKVHSSEQQLYHYLEQLNDAGFQIEKDHNDRYFISITDSCQQLVNEEFAFMSLLVQPDPASPPDVDMFSKVNDRLERLIEQLINAMRYRHQVILHDYAANQHLVEPIHFGNNHTTIIALDTYDLKCKQFSLYSVCELTETGKPFIHQVLHRNNATDMFGMAGEPTLWVTLVLHEHAYFQLQQEHPLSVPYLSRKNESYLFHGPVSSFAGIGRFVLEMPHLVDIEGPEEFVDYVWRKMV